MAILSAIKVLFLVLCVDAASQRSGNGWGSPPPGWGSPPASDPTEINEVGAAEVIGIGSAIAEHSAIITVVGTPDTPAVLNINTGSGVGLNQYASNYQQTQINADGTSSGQQGNSASNNGYAYESISGDVQGLYVDFNATGWSAVEGEGAVAQADVLGHQGSAPSSISGR